MQDGLSDTDEALIARVANGDQTAYRRLVDRHSDRALSLAQRIVGDRAAAEDCVQDIFITLWTKADRFNPAKARFTTWLFRLVTNRAIDVTRRRQLVALPDGYDVADERMEGEARLSEVHRSAKVRSAIAELPERQRLAVLLTYHEGYSNAESADILGCKIKALESLLTRAKKSLKRQLQAEAMMMEDHQHG